jgi:hypothetical protein
MDLSQLNTTKASDIPRACSLVDPFTNEILVDDDGKTIDIFLYGMKSTAARTATANRGRRSKANHSDEEVARMGAEFLADLTHGWSDNLHIGEERLDYSRANATKLYMDHDWIAEQVLQFARELENFDPKRQAS